MTSSANSMSISSHDSTQGSDFRETKKYLLLRDTVAKARWSHGGTRLLSKRSEQRVLKGSLWQDVDSPFTAAYPPPSRSISRSGSSITSPINTPQFKQFVESIEIEDLTLQCASAFLAEISDETCRLLLAIPTSEERFYVHSDQERMHHSNFINVGADVIVSKRNIAPCRATVKWKGRLAGKQGVWFGVEILDEQSKGTGDSDGSVNNIRLFSCDKNNGMFVNIAQVTLVPPKRPVRRSKKRAPSTPSQGSYSMTNGSQTSGDQYLNDLVSQTESELSFMDDITSAETVPLVDLQVNDRVAWPSDRGYEKALVRWIGTLPEDDTLHGEILVGVEFDNPIGKGTGVYKNRRLFEARRGHASLVPVDGLVKISSSSSSLRNPSDSGSQLSLINLPRREVSEPALPSNQHTTAAEVFESLGIDDSQPLQPSDLNNNNGERNADAKSPRIPSPTPELPSSQEPKLASSDRSRHPDEIDEPGMYQVPTARLMNGTHSHSCGESLSNSISSAVDSSPQYNVTVRRLADNHDTPPSAAPVAVSNGPLTDIRGYTESVYAPVLHSSGATNDHTDKQIERNGWSDSTGSLPEYATPRKVPPLVRANRHVSDGDYHTTYRLPKHFNKQNSFSRKKVKNKNGLTKMYSHSLGVKDMHDIVDELSLNSSANVSSVESLPHSRHIVESTELRTSAEPPSDITDYAPSSLAQRLSDNSLLEENKYLLVKMSDEPSLQSSHSSESTNHMSSSSSEGSYSPHLESILSPLPERTTPISLEAEPSMHSCAVTVAAAPLSDSFPATEPDGSFYILPDPPPEFMTDAIDSHVTDHNDHSMHVGLWKGIAGTESSSSSFMEAVLFLLSMSSDILLERGQESSYHVLKTFLLENIILPLRSGRFIESTIMNQWKADLNEISTGQLLSTSDDRELVKFITLLLQHICNVHPLYELNNSQAGFTMTLVAHRDARIGFPTVQKLLEKTCIQQQIKFNKVPDQLILILPRWTLKEEKIFPNLHIDLTDVLEYAKRVCHMCGEQAVFECPECYEHEYTDLSSAAFCQPCSQTVHKHSKRLGHMPIQLKMVTQLGDEESSILLLKGVMCVKDNHYTTLSVPPRATLPTSYSAGSSPDWLNFNSKAATKDSSSTETMFHIPEVGLVYSVPNWLSMDAYDDMAKDITSIPDDIRNVLHHCCLCVYSKS